MSPQERPLSRLSTLAIGAIPAAAGLYFILVAVGVLPIPGGRESVHGPLWIIFCAGLAFLLAGIVVISRAAVSGEISPAGDLPATAPRWVHLTQYVSGLAITACLAAIGTWIALGPGSRDFEVSGPFLDVGRAGETIGRTVFGIGALVTWLCVIAFAISGAKKLLGRSKS